MDVSNRPSIKVSPVDAAHRALVAAPVASSTSRDRILSAAELLWCRSAAIPSVRCIGLEAGRSPVTVLAPFGRLVDLYAEVIRRERSLLDEGWFSAHPKARAAFFRLHVSDLRARDPVLLRLPGLVLASIAGAGVTLPARMTVPWYSLAAFASEEELRLSA
jgi:hypothetical protein